MYERLIHARVDRFYHCTIYHILDILSICLSLRQSKQYHFSHCELDQPKKMHHHWVYSSSTCSQTYLSREQILCVTSPCAFLIQFHFGMIVYKFHKLPWLIF